MSTISVACILTHITYMNLRHHIHNMRAQLLATERGYLYCMDDPGIKAWYISYLLHPLYYTAIELGELYNPTM